MDLETVTWREFSLLDSKEVSGTLALTLGQTCICPRPLLLSSLALRKGARGYIHTLVCVCVCVCVLPTICYYHHCQGFRQSESLSSFQLDRIYLAILIIHWVLCNIKGSYILAHGMHDVSLVSDMDTLYGKRQIFYDFPGTTSFSQTPNFTSSNSRVLSALEHYLQKFISQQSRCILRTQHNNRHYATR